MMQQGLSKESPFLFAAPRSGGKILVTKSGRAGAEQVARKGGAESGKRAPTWREK